MPNMYLHSAASFIIAACGICNHCAGTSAWCSRLLLYFTSTRKDCFSFLHISVRYSWAMMWYAQEKWKERGKFGKQRCRWKLSVFLYVLGCNVILKMNLLLCPQREGKIIPFLIFRVIPGLMNDFTPWKLAPISDQAVLNSKITCLFVYCLSVLFFFCLNLYKYLIESWQWRGE